MFRFEDLGNKALFRGDESEVDEFFFRCGVFEPTMGVLPLPKNRGTPRGLHHAEIIHQLRQLTKTELGFDFDQGRCQTAY